jgi:hypothetical protein
MTPALGVMLHAVCVLVLDVSLASSRGLHGFQVDALMVQRSVARVARADGGALQALLFLQHDRVGKNKFVRVCACVCT